MYHVHFAFANVVRRSHSGITRLYQNVRLNGYQILFLSSRAIAQVRVSAVTPAWHIVRAC